MFNLTVTINNPDNAEREFTIEPPLNLGALEDTVTQIITDNNEATSFVFVVCKVS